MGAAKKFEDLYAKDEKSSHKDQMNDKKMIEAYISRINELLESPDKQKKAAQIISNIINKK